MPGTFSPPPTSRETANKRSRHASWHVRDAMAGKTFPAFPAHAQPVILRIWHHKRPMLVCWQVRFCHSESETYKEAKSIMSEPTYHFFKHTNFSIDHLTLKHISHSCFNFNNSLIKETLRLGQRKNKYIPQKIMALITYRCPNFSTMAWYKPAVSPLLSHWRCCSLAPSRRVNLCF